MVCHRLATLSALQVLARREGEAAALEGAAARMRYCARLYRLLGAVLQPAARLARGQLAPPQQPAAPGYRSAPPGRPPASPLQQLLQRAALLAASSCTAAHAWQRERQPPAGGKQTAEMELRTAADLRAMLQVRWCPGCRNGMMDGMLPCAA